ncbi:hypothetical protein PVIIG_04957 [Plasmodium vivax India VII]|uniref:Variable surface protein Vir21 n=1 Tax=Plasmodium vivax India VII TaxID=1077284 RepID=A0A0J9UXA9_PLAVI|nr:hypothetical protein PVIIG_04957 [Plasmodium vivax India VII]
MAPSKKIYTLNDFSDNNNKLINTDLYEFYHHHFDKECDNTSGSLHFCDSFNGDKSLNSSLDGFYRKLERNLKQIPTLSDKLTGDMSVDKHKLCFYLKYWFYDQVISKKIENNQITQLLRIWEQNKRGKSIECECELDVKSLPIIKKLKQYYDYYLFLEAYKDTASMSKEISYKEYCTYLDEARVSYSLFTSICFQKDHDSIKEYCNEFIKYIMEYLKIYDKSSISCQENELAQEEEEEEPQEEAGGREMDFRSLSMMGPNIAGHYMHHGSTETNQLMSMTHSSPTSEDTSRKTSTFTPVGSFLYPRVQNIKNKINNLIGGQTEVQQDAYNFYPTHMDNNRFNIAYQSG